MKFTKQMKLAAELVNKDEYISVDKNIVSFTIQDGPVKENGINGCQIDDVIEYSHHLIKLLNDEYPCTENERILYHLKMALTHSFLRKIDRKSRNVEGFNKE